jgi:hypothetical protein
MSINKRGALGALALLVEFITLAAVWLIYLTGPGVGPQDVTPLLLGVLTAGLGLLLDGTLGVISIIKGETRSLLAVIAIIVPIIVLAVFFARRVFSLG